MRALILILALTLLPADALAQRNGMMGGTGNMGNMGSGSLMPSTPLNGMYPMNGRPDLADGVRLVKQERYADAIPYLERALRQDEANVALLNLLGYVHRMTGDYQAAMDFYNRSLARNPNAKLPHAYMGELDLAMHHLGEARGQLAALNQLCPEGCPEKDALANAIDIYHRAANQPAAP